MSISDYEYLWRDREAGWVLFRLPTEEGDTAPHYVIENRKTQAALVIEDNDLAAAVIAEMLRHGVLVMGPSGS